MPLPISQGGYTLRGCVFLLAGAYVASSGGVGSDDSDIITSGHELHRGDA